MPIVGAAIVPNSVWLLPGINPQVHLGIKKTLAALKKLNRFVRSCKPDVLLVVSEIKGLKQPALYQNTSYHCNVSQFGDLITKWQATGHTGFVHSFKESMESKINLPLLTNSELPITIAAPVIALGLTTPLAILGLPTKMDNDYLAKLSELVREFTISSKNNIFVLVTASLSDPEGDVEAKIYNNSIIQSLMKGKEAIVNLDQKIAASGQSIIFPSILLYNILPSDKTDFNLLSLESYNNIGHLTSIITW